MVRQKIFQKKKVLHYIQVQQNNKISFKSNYQLVKTVDKLQTGPGWYCEIIDLAGNQVREDPVECVNELIGNPSFKDYISYVPEHVYTVDAGQDRIYDEMWTADWWWKTQVSQS